ncbi:MAG: hypothetical protein ACK449_04835 [Planctomycetota bacterium]|jgi:hypothetical protein
MPSKTHASAFGGRCARSRTTPPGGGSDLTALTVLTRLTGLTADKIDIVDVVDGEGRCNTVFFFF